MLEAVVMRKAPDMSAASARVGRHPTTATSTGSTARNYAPASCSRY